MSQGEVVLGHRECERLELGSVLDALAPPERAWVWLRGRDEAWLTTYDRCRDRLTSSFEGLLFWERGQVTWLVRDGRLSLAWLGDSAPAGSGWKVQRQVLVAENWSEQEQWVALANFETLDFRALGPVRDGHVLAVRRRRQVTESADIYERLVEVAPRPLSHFQPSQGEANHAAR